MYFNTIFKSNQIINLKPMKKIIFLSSMLVLACFSSCRKHENSPESGVIQTNHVKQSNVNSKISDEDAIKILQNHYKMSIENNIKTQENYLKLLNSSLTEKIENSGYKFSYEKKDMYSIPFKDRKAKKMFVSNFIDFQAIVENQVDTDGNGIIIITSEGFETTKTFEKGKLVTVVERENNDPLLNNPEISNKGKKPFRKCFDQAYDSICDGFIGCLAWYTSPLPALTAIGYCGLTT